LSDADRDPAFCTIFDIQLVFPASPVFLLFFETVNVVGLRLGVRVSFDPVTRRVFLLSRF